MSVHNNTRFIQCMGARYSVNGGIVECLFDHPLGFNVKTDPALSKRVSFLLIDESWIDAKIRAVRDDLCSMARENMFAVEHAALEFGANARSETPVKKQIPSQSDPYLSNNNVFYKDDFDFTMRFIRNKEERTLPERKEESTSSKNCDECKCLVQ